MTEPTGGGADEGADEGEEPDGGSAGEHSAQEQEVQGQNVPGESVEGQLRALRHEIGLLRDVVDDAMHPAGGDPQPGPGDAPFEPCYPSLEQWVARYFTCIYARPINPAVRWCARWWDHGEAISRLEALWRSWEAGRLDELRGIALWHRDFLDPQLAVLTSTTGPFAQCTPDRHAPTTALPTVPAPQGYWDDDEPDGQALPDGSAYRELR